MQKNWYMVKVGTVFASRVMNGFAARKERSRKHGKQVSENGRFV
jgi:hypothetical protein